MRLFGVLLLGMLTGFAVAYTGPALDLGFAVNAAASGNPAPTQWVDRTGKGDRLDRLGTKVGKQPVPEQKLLVGCEPAMSPLSREHVAVPGRCAA
jgi:hypothetical protein